MNIPTDRLREIAELTGVSPSWEEVEAIATELLACREELALRIGQREAACSELRDVKAALVRKKDDASAWEAMANTRLAERDAARAEAERLRAELLKSDTLAWEALGKPGGTFASTTVERLVMAHGIIKGEVGRLLAELAAVKRQRDELLAAADQVADALRDVAGAGHLAYLDAFDAAAAACAAEQPKPQQPEVQP